MSQIKILSMIKTQYVFSLDNGKIIFFVFLSFVNEWRNCQSKQNEQKQRKAIIHYMKIIFKNIK